jgi:hypothetical protein
VRSDPVYKKESLLTFFEQFLTRLNDRYLRHFLLRKTVRITAAPQCLHPVLPNFSFRCYSQAHLKLADSPASSSSSAVAHSVVIVNYVSFYLSTARPARALSLEHSSP